MAVTGVQGISPGQAGLPRRVSGKASLLYAVLLTEIVIAVSVFRVSGPVFLGIDTLADLRDFVVGGAVFVTSCALLYYLRTQSRRAFPLALLVSLGLLETALPKTLDVIGMWRDLPDPQIYAEASLVERITAESFLSYIKERIWVITLFVLALMLAIVTLPATIRHMVNTGKLT